MGLLFDQNWIAEGIIFRTKYGPRIEKLNLGLSPNVIAFAVCISGWKLSISFLIKLL
jgi:hypothetical protein